MKRGSVGPMWRLIICVGILLTATIFGAAAQVIRLDWRYPTGGQIRSEPAAGSGGSVYALSDDGFVYAFGPSGRVQWASNLGGLVTDSFSVGRDGTVYAGLLNGVVDAVNPRGQLIWSFDAGGSLNGNPATADDGTVFISTTSGTLYSVSLTGELEWKITLPARMTQPPVMDSQETLYLGASDGRLYALTRWGRFKWSLPLPGIPHGAAVGADGSVYLLVSGDLLVKVSPAGNVEWRRELSPGSYGPLIGAERIFVASREGNVRAFGLDGRPIWQQKVNRPVANAWVLGARRLYLMGSDKRLIELDEATGNLEGELPVDAVGSLALSPNGELLIGGRDWLVYAYSGITPGDAVQWGEPSADSRHSGHGQGSFDSAASVAALDQIPDYL
ncbi:MAG TPA: PQQ-binding-like beta-propeller repeat protein, partial [Spirochaetia bacterium]|nr:PQQ-binding-like beta-propeller repeat protein [Spirochaetia bacterium]